MGSKFSGSYSTKMADDGEDTANEFANLIATMKNYLQTNEIERALNYAEKAYEHEPSDKLSAKIKKMKKYLELEEDPVLVGNGFYVDSSIYKRLYPYQLEGILWMWSLYNKKTGGILGDDMGLGKTVQVISFLGGMFDMELVHTVLIVMPLSLITNWKKEFEEWTPGLNVFEIHGTKRERERNLRRIRHEGGVILTTYGLIVTSVETLSTNERGQKFTWDYLILDEGHKIKNPSKTTTAANELPAKCRLVLTGTPVQNNLQEVWSLFNFTHCGTLLGSLRTFHIVYENAIIHGCAKDASAAERQFGKHASDSLRNLVAPYFLRRTKQEIMKESLQPQLNAENQVLSVPNQTIPKNELVVWLYLSPVQVKIYREFLQLDKIKEILMSKRSPLVEFTVLKKICDHPRLMSVRCCAMLGLDGKENIPEDEIDLDTELQKVDIYHVTDEQLIQESGKLVFVLKLLEDLKRTGHRCLIFSQSRKMLDTIQRILKNRDFKCIRLDGTISKLQDRQTIIDNFQNKVTEAYETQGNKPLRRAYDQSLQISPLAGYAPSPSRNRHGPQTGRTSTFNYDEWVQQHYGEDYLSNRKTRYREEYYQTEYYRGKRPEKYRSYVYFKILGVVAFVTTITYGIMYYILRNTKSEKD